MKFSVEEVVNSKLCLACGFCEAACVYEAIQIVEDKTRGLPLPVINPDLCKNCGICSRVCPGRGIELISLAKINFPEAKEDLFVGRYRKIYVGYAKDMVIRKHSTSGGLVTLLVKHLMETKRVSLAILCRMQYSGKPRPEGYIATSEKEILESQGAKYLPVPLGKLLREIKQLNKPTVFVGLPCHIQGIRLFQQFDPSFLKLIPYTISLFCGGYKSYLWVDRLLKALGINPSTVTSLKFRALGWPGELEVKNISGRVVRYPYPDYGGLTNDIEPRRCVLCIDALGELADISAGDAWLPQYLEKRNLGGWSIVIARSTKGEELLEELIRSDCAFLKPISVSEVLRAQHRNIEFKKIRQNTRRWLFEIMGSKIPHYDGGYSHRLVGLFSEIRIVLRILINEWEEEATWKRLVAKMLRKALKFRRRLKVILQEKSNT